MRTLRLPFAAAAALTVACASGNPSPSSSPAPAASASPTASSKTVYKAPAKKNPRVISEEELQDPTATSRDALTALRHLRPSFFAYRGPTGSSQGSGGGGETMVSIDYGPLQRIDYLSTITTQGMKEVRYLDPNDAQNRFGLNANGGAVIVLLYNKQQ
jgi:hypothetical protein